MEDSLKDKIDKTDRLNHFKSIVKDIEQDLLKDIQDGKLDVVQKKLSKFSAEEMDLLMNESQPFKSIGPGDRNKFIVMSINNLREEYYKKLMTTTLVGFLYQMLKEYKVKEDDLTTKIDKNDFIEIIPNPDKDRPEYVNAIHEQIYNNELKKKYNSLFPNDETVLTNDYMYNKLNEDDLFEIATVTKQLTDDEFKPTSKINSFKLYDHVNNLIDEQSDYERIIINKFLNKYLQYNVNDHLQSGYDNNKTEDPERNALTPNSEDPVIAATHSNIPPNDTFSYLSSYYEINYDKLRQATNDLYNVKPDLEYAAIIYDKFDTKEDVDKFIKKYTTSSKLNFLSIPLNNWCILGPFEKNRERVNYFNKNNKIIEGMLDAQEEGASLCEALMKDRVEKKKVKNTKYFGPNDPKFTQYKSENPSVLETEYGITVTDTEDGGIKVETEVEQTLDGIGVDEDGTPLNAIEFDIHCINAKSGDMKTKTYYSKAQPN